METNFDKQVNNLRKKVERLLRFFSNADVKISNFNITIPEEFKIEFFELIDKVNFNLMEDGEDFYGYFLFHMGRDLRFDLTSPTGSNFQGAKYIIYFNPVLFLNLTGKQMESAIKHEILHIISLHFLRAKKIKNQYSKLAINIAMDIVVNKYLTNLWPDAMTIEKVNKQYSLNLKVCETFESYVKEIQTAIDLTQEEEKLLDDTVKEDWASEYDASTTHDIWEESSEVDAKTVQEFTEKIASTAQKGELPSYLGSLLDSLKNRESELPWHQYLSRLVGTIEGNKKKTVTRRNRRQPERFDLRGELRSHKAKIIVAIDISGSISTEEFKKAIIELLSIVKNYGHEITILECDDEVRRVYQIKSERDIKERLNTRGSTKFSPAFAYANQHEANLFIYFTDGKGEEKLNVIPNGYQILWVLSGKEANLSISKPYGPVKKLNYVEKPDNILDVTDIERGGYSMNNQERSI